MGQSIKYNDYSAVKEIGQFEFNLDYRSTRKLSGVIRRAGRKICGKYRVTHQEGEKIALELVKELHGFSPEITSPFRLSMIQEIINSYVIAAGYGWNIDVKKYSELFTSKTDV